MLEVTADNWLEQSWQEGRKEGRKEGQKEGRKEGKKEGRKEGRKEGQKEVLIGLLEAKFGPLNTETKNRLSDLNETRLLECAKRLLTAKTRQEVINP